MAADAIERAGLTFATLSEATIEKLKSTLPAAANCLNPVDVLGDALADAYRSSIETVMEDDNVDVVLVLLTPQAMTETVETANILVEASRNHPDKPVLACFLGADKVADAEEVLMEGGVPQYDSPESAVKVIAAMTEYVRWRNRPKTGSVKMYPVNRHRVERIIDRHLRREMREIGEMESKENPGGL